MKNSYTLVFRRKAGQSAFIYINNTPRTGKTYRFPTVFGKKVICPSLCRKVWQIDESPSEFLHKYAENAKNLQKVTLFSSFVFFCFFPYSEKGDFRFPAANRNEGIIASFPSFRLLSDKIIFYRDIKKKKKRPLLRRGHSTKNRLFPMQKCVGTAEKFYHIINIYSAVPRKKEERALQKRGAARKKIRKRCRGAAPFRYGHSHSMVATGFGERS